jgi:hypothetical protein
MSKKQLEMSEERHLDCFLTDDEVKQYGEDLAHRLMDIGALEAEKSRLTAKIKPIQKDVEILVQLIDTGKEVRSVPCDWDYDWNRGKKSLYRSDTAEIVPNTTFDISEDEKQIKLELDGQED